MIPKYISVEFWSPYSQFVTMSIGLMKVMIVQTRSKCTLLTPLKALQFIYYLLPLPLSTTRITFSVHAQENFIEKLKITT